MDNSFFKWEGEKSLKKYDEWFASFEKHTINYIRRKTNEEISKYSAMEYIDSSTKYLDSESERKEYINKKYHDKLDNINNKYIIEENMKKLISVFIKFI